MSVAQRIVCRFCRQDIRRVVCGDIFYIGQLYYSESSRGSAYFINGIRRKHCFLFGGQSVVHLFRRFDGGSGIFFDGFVDIIRYGYFDNRDYGCGYAYLVYDLLRYFGLLFRRQSVKLRLCVVNGGLVGKVYVTNQGQFEDCHSGSRSQYFIYDLVRYQSLLILGQFVVCRFRRFDGGYVLTLYSIVDTFHFGKFDNRYRRNGRKQFILGLLRYFSLLLGA